MTMNSPRGDHHQAHRGGYGGGLWADGTGHRPTPRWDGALPVQPVWERPVRRGPGVLNVLLVIGAALVVVAVALLLAMMLGTGALLLCGVLAFVPLTICVLGILWIDRWDPEPRGALLFAFLWGAGVSVVATLLLGTWVTDLLGLALATTSPDVIGPMFQAPSWRKSPRDWAS